MDIQMEDRKSSKSLNRKSTNLIEEQIQQENNPEDQGWLTSAYEDLKYKIIYKY